MKNDPRQFTPSLVPPLSGLASLFQSTSQAPVGQRSTSRDDVLSRLVELMARAQRRYAEIEQGVHEVLGHEVPLAQVTDGLIELGGGAFRAPPQALAATSAWLAATSSMSSSTTLVRSVPLAGRLINHVVQIYQPAPAGTNGVSIPGLSGSWTPVSLNPQSDPDIWLQLEYASSSDSQILKLNWVGTETVSVSTDGAVWSSRTLGNDVTVFHSSMLVPVDGRIDTRMTVAVGGSAPTYGVRLGLGRLSIGGGTLTGDTPTGDVNDPKPDKDPPIAPTPVPVPEPDPTPIWLPPNFTTANVDVGELRRLGGLLTELVDEVQLGLSSLEADIGAAVLHDRSLAADMLRDLTSR